MKTQIFYNSEHQMELLISPKNPEDRDFIEMPRFQLLVGHGMGKSVLTVSEDWEVIQERIENYIQSKDHHATS